MRLELHARIKEASKARRAARTTPMNCTHTWQTFKQTVTVENNRFTGSAYFTVHGRTRCHAKERLDYRVGGDR
ncbi:hypothetical protein MT349_02540 [Rathayibacter caricis]|uniref:hypothetical protein n=1 Tax=Rathayibacter caricis TaxID=110936 RepID=UPI001FB53298|nr:hypothetical protein [Rathayibacter caricis]MCJ1694648.1 hypothetical protein [Rathayibacter caricis]